MEKITCVNILSWLTIVTAAQIICGKINKEKTITHTHQGGEIEMTKMVDVINGNRGETVDIATVITTDQAESINRVFEESYIAAEYQEPAVMPDGRKCLKIYQFDEDEVKDAQADDNDAWEESLPWDDEHVDHVVIYD